MNTEEQRWKQNGEAVTAHGLGRPVECSDRTAPKWLLVKSPTWAFNSNDYRPAPEPVSRNWTAKDVPPVCWLRDINGVKFDKNCMFLVVAFGDMNVSIWASNGRNLINWSDLGKYFEHSTDLREWKPCKVIEGEPAKPESAHKPHNPAGLWDELVGVKDGWRLLDADEIVTSGACLEEIEALGAQGKWRGGGFYGCIEGIPFRTKLNREELKKTRGL